MIYIEVIIITNDEFLQYENLIYKIINKYRNNKHIEYDDLYQIASIGLYECFNKYNNEMEQKISFMSYLYNNIEWSILKELKKYERIEAFTSVSLHHETGEDTTIEDILQDIKTDIETNIIDKIVLEEYMNEFNKHLDDIELNVLCMRIFDEMKYKDIEQELNLGSYEAYGIFIKSRRKLLNKSSYIRERYLSYINANTNIYKNPAKVVLNKII